MTDIRGITQFLHARPTNEGAGVRLNRAFGYTETPHFDPFLMLDDFRSPKPSDYLAGFPWHPHRGIETVTYMLEGRVEHGDSMGNAGFIGAGDLQWMTAGSGIIHQEMPKPVNGQMGGFQLWVNLPAAQKMMRPRYQEVKSVQVPVVEPAHGVRIRVIAGRVAGTTGPVQGIIVDPLFTDISMGPDISYEIPIPGDHVAFSYVIEGDGIFAPDTPHAANRTIVRYGAGDSILVRAGGEGVRFLLIGGRPIREPIAWGGPIVMNTQEELIVAFEEYRDGTFIKS